MRWLSRAATLKQNSAQRELGLLLLRGDGVARDTARAISLLTAPAKAGDPVAAAALGAAQASGDGVPRDWPGALKWTREAADAGFKAAVSPTVRASRTTKSAVLSRRSWKSHI